MRWRRAPSGGLNPYLADPYARRRRRRRGMAAGGGGSLLLVLGLLLAFGVFSSGAFDYRDPFDRFPSEAQARRNSRATVPQAPSTDQTVRFLGFVIRDIQEFWAQQFQRAGSSYRPTELVVFGDETRVGDQVGTGCGVASDEVGPFYCPVDQRVYLDLDFFVQLERRFQAPGDFAQAYVVAHEVGHHLQTLTGVSRQVAAAGQQEPGVENELSVRQELQADCLAGVWAHSTYERGLLERGDLDEGLQAAAAVGDDRIQAETQGQINPETWTHGSSEQRREWFLRGFESGDADQCDTFSGGV